MDGPTRKPAGPMKMHVVDTAQPMGGLPPLGTAQPNPRIFTQRDLTRRHRTFFCLDAGDLDQRTSQVPSSVPAASGAVTLGAVTNFTSLNRP